VSKITPPVVDLQPNEIAEIRGQAFVFRTFQWRANHLAGQILAARGMIGGSGRYVALGEEPTEA